MKSSKNWGKSTKTLWENRPKFWKISLRLPRISKFCLSMGWFSIFGSDIRVTSQTNYPPSNYYRFSKEKLEIYCFNSLTVSKSWNTLSIENSSVRRQKLSSLAKNFVTFCRRIFFAGEFFSDKVLSNVQVFREIKAGTQ